MRRRDYLCRNGHAFEYVDSMHDPVFQFLPCPKCHEPALRQVARVQIGKISKGYGWITTFPGGRSLTTEEVERRLDYKPPEPFSDQYLEKTREQRAEQVERMMAKQDAGELPKPRDVTPKEREMVEKALKEQAS